MTTLLSLFDGIGTAGLAMRSLFGDNFEYIASEIDPDLKSFTDQKFPNIRHLGTVQSVTCLRIGSKTPDYLICGSPCQGLSKAGKRKGLEDDRSSLFWDAVRVKQRVQPKWWIFENVVGSKADMAKMSEALGVEPIIINSRYFTYQNRLRAYWTNIPVVNPDSLMNLKSLTGSRIIHRAFGHNRETYYYPTLTRNIMTNAWGRDVFMQTDDQGHRHFSILPLTWSDFETAQGIPIGYTDLLPNVKRRLALANAFTLPVIEYILRFSMLIDYFYT